MSENPYIQFCDLPRWYGLAVTDAGMFEVTMTRPCWEDVRRQIIGKMESTVAFGTERKLARFTPPTEPNWGFGNCLSTKLEEGDARLCVENPTTGTRNVHLAIQRATEMSSTLSLLFLSLFVYHLSTAMEPLADDDPAPRQLLTVDALGNEPRPSGYALFASVSRFLAFWLTKTPSERIMERVPPIMRMSFLKLWKDPVYGNLSEYRIHHDANSLALCCPGDACDLSPEDIPPDPDYGYKLVPHNMDNPIQQICLLTGLAAIHGLADEHA